jgi:LSD1 subclass zinc finger protein
MRPITQEIIDAFNRATPVFGIKPTIVIPEIDRRRQVYIDQQDVRGNMTCGTCRRMLWDCPCPKSVECSACGLEQEDAKWLEAKDELYVCDSPDGLHTFVSKDREP